MMKITNKLPSFTNKLSNNMDIAFREATRNILINAKTKAPFAKGGLRSDTDGRKVSTNKWRVSFWKEYARFQEFGGDAKRRIRNYTSPGTGKAFLRTAGDAQAKNLTLIIKKHIARTRP